MNISPDAQEMRHIRTAALTRAVEFAAMANAIQWNAEKVLKCADWFGEYIVYGEVKDTAPAPQTADAVKGAGRGCNSPAPALNEERPAWRDHCC